MLETKILRGVKNIL